MKKIMIVSAMLGCLVLAACKSAPKLTYYDPTFDEAESDSNEAAGETAASFEDQPGEIISVPYEERGNVKYVDVSVNGFGFQMIFDTGCSGTLISVAEARYLYEKGYLTEDDFLGVTKSQIADGSIVENMVVNLKEVVIGNKILCKDVQATVSANNNAPLLLGNEVLNRVAAYSVDNENKTINFKCK